MFEHPSDYAMAQAFAKAKLCNRAIAAFQPAGFAKVGYPIDVVANSELLRYVDCMHEGRVASTMAKLGGLTEAELTVMETVATATGAITERWGERRVPRSSLLSAVMAYREIVTLAKPGKAIFEIGPGSGYLGAMLIASGYRYRCVEPAQAFFLYQQALFEEIGKGRYIQWAWWDWLLDPPDLDYAIVTANHCLGEMTDHALKYNLKMAAKMLGNEGRLVIDSLSGYTISSEGDIRNVIASEGFEIAAGCKQVAVYESKNAPGRSYIAPTMDIVHGMSAFDDMLGRVLGKPVESTPDEHFLRSIGVDGV